MSFGIVNHFKDHQYLDQMVGDMNSDYNKDFRRMTEDNGFVFDEYEVETEDGYLLTLYRVRTDCYTNEGGMEGAPVVFFQHGLVSSADTWVAHYPAYSPAFVLAR